jgi:hypothetical protein
MLWRRGAIDLVSALSVVNVIIIGAGAFSAVGLGALRAVSPHFVEATPGGFGLPRRLGCGNESEAAGLDSAVDPGGSASAGAFEGTRLVSPPSWAAVYASCSALPPPHATLASRRLARPYLRRTSTG